MRRARGERSIIGAVFATRHLQPIAFGSTRSKIAMTQSQAPDHERALEGCAVLLLDQDAVILLATELDLRDLGAHDVRACLTSAEALASCAASRPDCAIISVDGRDEAAQRGLLDALAQSGVPAVLVSARDDPPSISGDEATLLLKPFARHALLDACASALARQRPR